METNTDSLDRLALVAHDRALRRHRIELSPQHLQRLQQVLDCERASAEADERQALSAIYGAWLGCWAVAICGGRWVGLHEPVAPRVSVAGWCFSPIDCVERLLDGQPQAVPIASIAAWIGQRLTLLATSQRRQEVLGRNAAAWDALADDPRFTSAPADSEAESATDGLDPWLVEHGLQDRDVLCLAAGGGLHGPLFARAGGRVTVVDLSKQQLDHDRRYAEATGLPIRTVESSIDALDDLSSAAFDVIVQPVSSCYLPELATMFGQVARLLRPGGLYISQHKQPAAQQLAAKPSDAPAPGRPRSGAAAGADGGWLVIRPAVDGLPLDEDADALAAGWREPGTAEFVHTVSALLGGICRAGLVIDGLEEPPRGDWLAPCGSPAYRAAFVPPYIKVRARKPRA